VLRCDMTVYLENVVMKYASEEPVIKIVLAFVDGEPWGTAVHEGNEGHITVWQAPTVDVCRKVARQIRQDFPAAELVDCTQP